MIHTIQQLNTCSQQLIPIPGFLPSGCSFLPGEVLKSWVGMTFLGSYKALASSVISCEVDLPVSRPKLYAKAHKLLVAEIQAHWHEKGNRKRGTHKRLPLSHFQVT